MRRSQRRGASYVIVLLGLLTLAATATLSIDLGMLLAARQQLQNAADAAALAGVGVLQLELDAGLAAQAAVDTAACNKVLKTPVTLDLSEDVTVGAWDEENGEIIPFDDTGGAPSVPDGVVAVRVSARRTVDSPDGPIPAAFGRLLGFEHFETRAAATAGLTVSRRERPPVDAVILQDQSGSFADEFPYARAADAEFLDFMGECYADGDRTGVIGFGYHPYHDDSTSPKRRDHWIHNRYPMRSNGEEADELAATRDFITGMPTIPYNVAPTRNGFTNLYTGMLRATLELFGEDVAVEAWSEFAGGLYYSSTLRDIGWWRTNRYSSLKTKLATLMDHEFSNPDAEHVVVLVSDGMPWFHSNSFPDTKSKDLCTYIADLMAAKGIRIHTVTLDQSDRPGDGSMGADSQFNASLVRNGGYAFYTYDAGKLANLLVGVGQVEVGQAHLID